MTTPASLQAPIHSMTGFASLEQEAGGQRYRVEVRSVNARFLDLKFRMPKDLQSLEPTLRTWVTQRVSRGTVDIKIEKISDLSAAGDGIPGETLPLSFLEPQARVLKTRLENLREQLGLAQAPLTLRDLLEFRELFVSRSAPEASSEETLRALEPIVIQALGEIEKMRAHEGANLARVLLGGVTELESALQRIKARRSEWIEKAQTRNRERIQNLFESFPLPAGLTGADAVLESRLAQELALLLDRTDIAEEIDRAQGHFEHFRKTLEQGGPVGKKLEFLLQEMHREVNTLGNKAQDLGISEEIVQAKVRLEQLREQILNLA
jgi:uncharacterized protein (TIGR00255 family)